MARVQLTRPLPSHLEHELGKRVYFISSGIHGFSLVHGEQGIEALDLTLAPHTAESIATLAEKMNLVVDREVRTQRRWKPKVLWRSARAPGQHSDPLPDMIRDSLVHVPAPGTMTFGELMIWLLDYLDERLRASALAMPASAEYRYPTLLPVEVLERQNYFESFPHFVMFVTYLHNDAANYAEFARRYRMAGRKLTEDVFGLCRDNRLCLPPTMCYHTYHQLSGSCVDNRVVTSQGKSFRFESRYQSGLDRLWDFTIRETVFLGAETYVTESRDRFLEAAFALMDELDLAATCEVANDHFFGDASSDRMLSQRLMELKYELLAEVADGRRVAVGSFNLHGRHFGEHFAIKYAGAPAHTGCVGFGLERLAYSFVCQHGTDPARWPAVVRDGIGS